MQEVPVENTLQEGLTRSEGRPGIPKKRETLDEKEGPDHTSRLVVPYNSFFYVETVRPDFGPSVVSLIPQSVSLHRLLPGLTLTSPSFLEGCSVEGSRVEYLLLVISTRDTVDLRDLTSPPFRDHNQRTKEGSVGYRSGSSVEHPRRKR